MTRRSLTRRAGLTLALCCVLAGAPVHAAKEAAVNVAVYGFEYPQNMGAAINTLAASGYSASAVTLPDIAAGLPGYDVLYITHAFDGGGWSTGACNGMKSFLAAGKGVALEWDAAILPFGALGTNIYVNAAPQCAMFTGTADRGKSVGFNTAITVTDATSPLVKGLPNPFAMGAASDYMYQISGFDPAIWKVSATYSGWNSPNNMALMYGRYKGAGCVALGTMAYGDNGYSTQFDPSSRQLFLNLIGTVAPGVNSCKGVAVPDTGFPVPASSPASLLLLFALIAGSAFGLRRRFDRRGN